MMRSLYLIRLVGLSSTGLVSEEAGERIFERSAEIWAAMEERAEDVFEGRSAVWLLGLVDVWTEVWGDHFWESVACTDCRFG